MHERYIKNVHVTYIKKIYQEKRKKSKHREGLKFLEREGEKSRDLCSPGEEASHLPLLVLVFPLGL
jgi:hypothetical protein